MYIYILEKNNILLGHPKKNPNATDNPFKTIFIYKLDRNVNENQIKNEFKKYGEINKIRLIRDLNGRSRRYCFIEFKHSKTLKKLHRGKSKRKLGDKYYYLDFEKGRKNNYWLPQRLGGGKGDFERDYPRKIYRDIKILKKIYPELKEPDEGSISSISISSSSSEQNSNDNYNLNYNSENQIDVDEYLRIKRERSKSENKQINSSLNENQYDENDIFKLCEIDSNRKNNINVYEEYNEENNYNEDINKKKNNIEEITDNYKLKSRSESLNNDKSYEKIKKRNSRSRSRKRSINTKYNRRKKSESDEREYENSLNMIRKKSESSKRRRRIKSHIINGNQSEEESKEKSEEENKEENKVKSEEENKEKSEEESENSLNAIRKKIRQYKRDNSSVSTIRKNSSVKSDDDSDSKATVILTAENRRKYGLGEINIK